MGIPPLEIFLTPAPIPPRGPEPRPPRQPSTGPSGSYWTDVDNQFSQTIRRAEQAFKVSLVINIIVVGVGVSLVLYSIIYSWVKGLDVFAIAFGTVGVADFVAIFFLNPQKNIHKDVGSLVQVQIAYRTYLRQCESLSDYDWQRFGAGNRTLDDVEKMNADLGKVSIEAIKAIAQYAEEEAVTRH